MMGNEGQEYTYGYQIAALTNVAAQYDPPLSSGSVDPNANGLYQEFLRTHSSRIG
jgi:hypothetical protein